MKGSLLKKVLIVVGIFFIPFYTNAMGLCAWEKSYIVQQNGKEYLLPHLSVIHFFGNGPLSLKDTFVIKHIHYKKVCRYKDAEKLENLHFENIETKGKINIYFNIWFLVLFLITLSKFFHFKKIRSDDFWRKAEIYRYVYSIFSRIFLFILIFLGYLLFIWFL